MGFSIIMLMISNYRFPFMLDKWCFLGAYSMPKGCKSLDGKKSLIPSPHPSTSTLVRKITITSLTLDGITFNLSAQFKDPCELAIPAGRTGGSYDWKDLYTDLSYTHNCANF